jgi:hypothetical protein
MSHDQASMIRWPPASIPSFDGIAEPFPYAQRNRKSHHGVGLVSVTEWRPALPATASSAPFLPTGTVARKTVSAPGYAATTVLIIARRARYFLHINQLWAAICSPSLLSQVAPNGGSVRAAVGDAAYAACVEHPASGRACPCVEPPTKKAAVLQNAERRPRGPAGSGTPSRLSRRPRVPSARPDRHPCPKAAAAQPLPQLPDPAPAAAAMQRAGPGGRWRSPYFS